MKHRSAAAVVLALALSVTACGQSKPAKTVTVITPPPAAASAPASSSSSASSSSTPSATPTPGETATATSTPGASSSTASASSSAPASAPSTSSDWTMWPSARFGFSAPIPPGWTVESSAANGDGVAVSGPDGAHVSYAGANVMSDPNVTGGPCKDDRDALLQRGVQITYASDTSTGCVITGTLSGNVIYDRMWVGQGSRVLMSWEYPIADKATIDPYVERAGNTIQIGDLSRSH